MPARCGPAVLCWFEVEGGGGGCSERSEGPALLWPAPAQTGVECVRDLRPKRERAEIVRDGEVWDGFKASFGTRWRSSKRPRVALALTDTAGEQPRERRITLWVVCGFPYLRRFFKRFSGWCRSFYWSKTSLGWGGGPVNAGGG